MKNPIVLIMVLTGLQLGSVASAKCTNATLRGTVVAALGKIVAGAPASSMYMESWDGVGNLQYLETDSNGAAGQTELISTELLVDPAATTGPCSTATLKGTLTFAVEKASLSGGSQSSAGMESYDGAGNLHYLQTDSDGSSTTNYRGSGTYTITAGCVASVYYDGSTTPFVYFVAPNGSAFWWINNQNTGIVAAGKETRMAAGLILK